MFSDAFHYALKIVASKIKSKKLRNTVFRLRHAIWKSSRNLGKRYYKYFDLKFRDADLIIIDGAGLLEYSFNGYQESLALITEYGNSHEIPVVFNAIGRAGEFDTDDFRCKVLIKAFQRRCVSYVSARDSLETVQTCVGSRFNVKLLADAAFCVSDAFEIQAKPRNKVIGIGLIRGDAFSSYGDGFGEERCIELFCEIAEELNKRGFHYEFFTNGYSGDYSLGLKVLERMGTEGRKLVDRPTDASVLLNTISSYEGIITCRMHSSIAAFSMGIPSVILSWNEKVDKYMQNIGYPDRLIPQSDMQADIIVSRLINALEEGVSNENIVRMKSLAFESVLDYKSLFI